MGAVPDYMLSRKSAWHGLGNIIGRFFSSDEILSIPELNYGVGKYQLIDPFTHEPIPVWGTFREDGEKKTFLKEVGKDYTILHHSLGVKMLDDLIRADESQKTYFETAGTLWGGAVFFASLKLPQDIHVGNDTLRPFLCQTSAYNGRYAENYFLSIHRPVCENTVDLALAAASAMFKVYHTKSGEKKLKDAHAAILAIGTDIQSVEEKLNFLNARMMTKDTVESIFNRLFPKTKKEDGREDSSTRRDNIIIEIMKNFEDNDNHTFKDQEGTAYSFLNSITKFVDHQRSSHNGEKGRRESATMGSGADLKSSAMDLITQCAQSLPPKLAPIKIQTNNPSLAELVNV